jgi:hypothetical protein
MTSLLQLALPMLLFAQTGDEEGASLAELQRRAQATRVALANNKDQTLDFVEKPVFRYTDELRNIEQAGIWLWTDRGQPAAMMKVERYRQGERAPHWLYCFASLSPERIGAEWDGNPPFVAREPGIAWTPLENEPANSRPKRLVQMRDLARRFSATQVEPTAKQDVFQMRLLPRPLYRYDEGLDVDGAVFGFTGTGTNPDLLLILESAKSGGWRYGFAAMTVSGLTVKLEDAVIWQRAAEVGPSRVFENWTYFVPKD